MSRKSFKRFVIAAGLVVSLLLSSCSGEAASLGAADGTDTGTTAAKDKTKVVYQTWNPDVAMFELLENDFETKNPDIDVEFVYVAYSDHIQKLKIDLSSGQGPDVFGLQAGATMTEFSDFLEDVSSFAESGLGKDWTSNLNPIAKQLLENDGKYYGLPLGISYAGLVWGDRISLASYNLELPASLADLTETAKILRENKQYPLAIGAKDDWINLDMWMNIGNDVNTEKLYSSIAGETPFTDPDMVETFSIWQSLFTDGIFQDGALGVNMYSDTTDLFNKEGSIPMITNGSWQIGNYIAADEAVRDIWTNDKHDMAVTIIDWNNDGTPAKIQGSVDSILCMNKDSKNKEAAWKLLQYMYTDGQDILINELLAYFPSRLDLEFTGTLPEAGMKNYDQIVEWGANNVGGYRENPYPELKQAIADNLKALALNSITPEEAAAKIETVSKNITR